ncbi:MAG: Glu-tRNA(Gln) amidotransferase subunit GatE, partial [Nanoarchaeota archaeon]
MFDYQDLNLKIGLEIHQQLSSKKLFCNCSTKFKEEKFETEFKRRLRAVAGEQGYVDVAAAFEESKNREFTYHGYKDEYCLVECDEEPPHEINQDALVTALSVAKLLKLKIPDEIIVMRKIITDGSACSSFQRTMLIGYESKDSFIETSQGKVRITSLCLEEDACKIEKVHENKVYYSLSRLGIPLIEIRTEPDIKTPEQAKEAAEELGLMLRSFSNILRGIGTIRQDVNLSIKNGARVEIKGFQELRTMPKIIDYEISRQVNVVKQGNKVEKEVRKANDNGTTNFLRPLPGSARMYP